MLVEMLNWVDSDPNQPVRTWNQPGPFQTQHETNLV